jgi:hypothetical protein
MQRDFTTRGGQVRGRTWGRLEQGKDDELVALPALAFAVWSQPGYR